MLTPTNRLDCPEITCYSRQEVEGGVVVCYLLRDPGERCWQPVALFSPSEIQIIAQEAVADWYTNPDAEPFCTGTCILPPIA